MNNVNEIANTAPRKLVVNRATKKYNVKESCVGIAFASPWIIGFLLLMAFPIVYSLALSFTNTSTRTTVVIFKGFSNFANILSDKAVWTSIGHTFIYVGLSVPLNLVFALMLALILNAKTKGTKVYKALYYVPTLVTIVAVAFLWKQILNPNGLLNSFLGLFGIKGPAWLTDYFWATPALVLMGMWSVGGIVVIFSAALTDVPTNLYEAADIDGAGKLTKFFKITLPTLSPIIFYNLLTTTVGAFQIFAQPMLMTGGAYNTKYFGYMIYDMAFTSGSQGYASAMSWLMLVIVLLVTAVIKALQKKFVFYND